MSRAALLQLAWGGLHPDRVRLLLGEWGNADRVVRAICEGALEVVPAVRAAIAVPADEREAQLAQLGIGFLTPDDHGYPDHLAQEPERPPFLFIRGGLPSGPGVAVVGTRRSTSYGRRVAYAYGWALAEADIPVVSGLARGIDAAAHRGVADQGGCGVSVMGCGLDRVYPREHAGLLERLQHSGGGAISEYPPGATPQPWRFPPRNRIIVLLAAVVVVVEANITGGALITARHALSHSREVLATPGDITRAASAGTNQLIRDGAIPVFDAADLLAALSLMPAFAARLTRRRPAVSSGVLDRTGPDCVLDGFAGGAGTLDQKLIQ